MRTMTILAIAVAIFTSVCLTGCETAQPAPQQPLMAAPSAAGR
ncbi:MAG: hypothetical protein PHX74_00490 [Candidatus Sumerlaeales bacterium]|nr:hypothetical protein [Candidatus Sumerlaeales bacterium]